MEKQYSGADSFYVRFKKKEYIVVALAALLAHYDVCESIEQYLESFEEEEDVYLLVNRNQKRVQVGCSKTVRGYLPGDPKNESIHVSRLAEYL